jgi:hypothetical protein
LFDGAVTRCVGLLDGVASPDHRSDTFAADVAHTREECYTMEAQRDVHRAMMTGESPEVSSAGYGEDVEFF